jgi:hypothetical protein
MRLAARGALYFEGVPEGVFSRVSWQKLGHPVKVSARPKDRGTDMFLTPPNQQSAQGTASSSLNFAVVVDVVTVWEYTGERGGGVDIVRDENAGVAILKAAPDRPTTIIVVACLERPRSSMPENTIVTNCPFLRKTDPQIHTSAVGCPLCYDNASTLVPHCAGQLLPV